MHPIESNKLPVFTFGNFRHCTYCGDPATSRDHVIAVSYQQLTRKSSFENCGPLTWACGSCNAALNNRWFDSFSKRCQWASLRIAQTLYEIAEIYKPGRFESWNK